MSSSSGSADVLEALGAKIDLSPASVARCIDETGFGFMFAQGFHPSMRFAAGPRREIGIRTVFNILGPLTNPAGAGAQVIGVADASMASKMAQVLGRLGSSRALVVHGSDGLDEITIADSTRVWELKEGAVSEYDMSPADFGLSAASLDDIQAPDAEASASTLRDVLSGKAGAGAGCRVAECRRRATRREHGSVNIHRRGNSRGRDRYRQRDAAHGGVRRAKPEFGVIEHVKR